MITWTTVARQLHNRRQLKAFKALNPQRREAAISVFDGILTKEDAKALSYPNLKGLGIYYHFAKRLEDAEILFDVILENKGLELVNIALIDSELVLPYHMFVHRAFASNTLRLPQIYLPSWPEKKPRPTTESPSI